MPKLFILIPFLLVVAWGRAQKIFHFETFSTRDGLSHNEVRSLLRDSRGFLWIGTANGLNRYDGYQFRNFFPDPRHANSLGGELVVGLAEGPEGRIWIAHNHGLDIYDPARDTFLRVAPRPEDVPDWSFNHGCSILFLPDGRGLITKNADKILLFPAGSTTYESIPAPEAPRSSRPVAYRDEPVNIIVNVIRKSPAEAWVSSKHGIFSLNVDNRSFTHHPLAGCNWYYNPQSLLYDTLREQLWFTAFDEDLYSFAWQDGSWRKWGLRVSGFINTGNDICTAPGGGIWMNQPGILYPEGERFVPVQHFPDDIYSFPAAATTVALHDYDGILWAGTSAGLTKLDPALQGFLYTPLSSHPLVEYDNSVYEIFDNRQDSLWYITSFYTGRIFTYDPRNGRDQDITQAFRPAVTLFPTRIYEDSRGLTWLLGNNRLYQADLAERILTPIPMPPLPAGVTDRATFDITEDSQGDLWIAKWRAGLLHYEHKSGTLAYAVPPPEMQPPRTSFVLAASRDRTTIWIGTHGEGVFALHTPSGRWNHLPAMVEAGRQISLMDVAGLTVDSMDNLWIATRQGLLRRTPGGKVRLFTQTDGLASTFLEGIRADGRGRLWLATGNGISCLDTRTFEIRNYQERHGLQIDAALDYFSIHDDGTIFSGTRQGFIHFHPDSLHRDTLPPRLALLSFRTGGLERKQEGLGPDYWQEITLRHRENFFTIVFTALNFTLPEENRYFYQLRGLDPDWIEAGKGRTASYTNVPPGRYEFCLKVKNKDGVWSREEKRLTILIRPPFWHTYWFWSATGLLLGALSYGGYQLRFRQIRREEEMKADFRNKLAKVEMAALRSQMNPHFLFNCLNSINRFIQRNEPDTASTYLTKFSRLIRLVLDNSRSDTISLHDELEALRLYVEMEAMRFVGKFSYQFEIAPELDTSSIEIPPMLIQPYVENAIWHGLMHKEHQNGLLLLKVNLDKGRLMIVVEDNGVGREMAQLLKSKSATLHKSHGMKVTAERIEIINEIYEAQAVVRIVDLTDELGKAAGTRVELSLPLK